MLVVMHRLWLKAGTFGEFARLSREQVWPVAEACGQRILGLYLAEEPHPNPAADGSSDMAILVTAYVDHDHFLATRADADSWAYGEELRARKEEGAQARRALTLAVHPSFLEPCRVKIGGPFWPPYFSGPAEQSALPPVSDPGLVVMRRFWIPRGSFDEFEQLSREFIWPEIEAGGARVQGMYRAAEPHPNADAGDDCDMVVLFTGYAGIDHWHATRANADTWAFSEESRQRMRQGGRPRAALTRATHPTFTTPAKVPIGGPFRTPSG